MHECDIMILVGERRSGGSLAVRKPWVSPGLFQERIQDEYQMAFDSTLRRLVTAQHQREQDRLDQQRARQEAEQLERASPLHLGQTWRKEMSDLTAQVRMFYSTHGISDIHTAESNAGGTLTYQTGQGLEVHHHHCRHRFHRFHLTSVWVTFQSCNSTVRICLAAKTILCSLLSVSISTSLAISVSIPSITAPSATQPSSTGTDHCFFEEEWH